MPIDKTLLMDGVRLLSESFLISVSEPERTDYRRQFIALVEKEGRIVGPVIVRFVALLRANKAVGSDFYNRMLALSQLPACKICGRGRGKPIKRQAEYTKDGHKVSVLEEVSICSSCQGEFYTPRQEQILQDAVAKRLARLSV